VERLKVRGGLETALREKGEILERVLTTQQFSWVRVSMERKESEKDCRRGREPGGETSEGKGGGEGSKFFRITEQRKDEKNKRKRNEGGKHQIPKR